MVICINETHHAYYGDGDYEDDEDEADHGISNETNTSDGEWVVVENTDSNDPCLEACNATCDASSCSPRQCVLMTTTMGDVANSSIPA
eukprot:1504979-Amphidinium_carterae.1